jgi:hypothetical protein
MNSISAQDKYYSPSHHLRYGPETYATSSVVESEMMETEMTDIATSLMDLQRVPSLLEQLKTGYENLQISGREGRQRLWLLAQELQHALATPREIMTKHCFSEVSLPAKQAPRILN